MRLVKALLNSSLDLTKELDIRAEDGWFKNEEAARYLIDFVKS